VGNKLCVGLVAAVVGGYLLRRQGLRWGATDEEVHKPLPGDEIVSHPMLETTHTVTIDASAEEIWRWLVQMGHYRAGFYADPSWWDKYSDKYLRSLSRKEAEESGYGFREIPSDERIIPEFQDLKEGDTILDGPPGSAFFTLRLMQPNRALVLYSDSHLRFLAPRSIRENPRYGIYGEFTWAFVLEERGEEHASDREDQSQPRATPLSGNHYALHSGRRGVLHHPQDALRHQAAGRRHQIQGAGDQLDSDAKA
jgi:hypothetical protein